MSEYLPLAKLIEQGLQEGTVLECRNSSVHWEWDGTSIFSHDQNGDAWGGSFSPLDLKWRIVSTPPKKITFEAVVSGALGYKHTRVPDYAEFKAGDAVIVTVEEKR